MALTLGQVLLQAGQTMKDKLVVVFGGSGFLGTHIVRALCKDGWRVRVACRRPHRALALQVNGQVGQVQLVQANIRMPASIDRALQGADAVVNLVGVLFEEGRQKFTSLHVRGAGLVASRAAAHGIANLVHMSALGADATSPSRYARSKAEGETRVRDAVPDAVILRPSVVFGPGDGLFERFAALAVLSPVLPLIGGGHSRFQPLYAGDLARAVLAALNTPQARGTIFALGGPEVMTLKQIMELVVHTIRRRRLLLPVPWFAANLLGWAGEIAGALPFVTPFLTRDQVLLLKSDNVVDDSMPGLADLGVTGLETAQAIVPDYLVRYRPHGQFNDEVLA